jgi:hypothetical protein
MWQEREGAITHVCFVTAGTATAPVEGAEYGPAVFFYAATNADGSHGVVCEADDKGAKERCVSLRRIPPAWGGGLEEGTVRLSASTAVWDHTETGAYAGCTR